MKRTVVIIGLALGVAHAAYADLTVKSTTGGKGLGLSGSAPGTTYIKGNKMRADAVMGDKTMTSIYDLDAQKMYVFDSKKKEADVWDMAAFASELSKSVDTSSAKATLKPNGQTKQIGGKTATGYDVEVSMNSALGGGKDMNLTVTLAGPVWVVKGAPGSADYARFYKAAAEKGFIFTNPAAAKAQPGQARAVAEMYNQMAATGGIPYDMDVQVKLSGSGPMAALMSRMGNITMTNVVESAETTALADDLFAPPAGYKLNTKK
jgi:hypothetical protein